MGPFELVRRLSRQGIRDRRVLEAVLDTPRDLFVPPELRERAWEDRPLPIGRGQTISQPYVVAFMLELLGLGGGERVLEIGTGSGYQTALLSRLCARVYSIEILAPLLDGARAALERVGAGNVELRLGDGQAGWPEQAPFDAVVVSAAAERVPEALITQLGEGGRLVAPVGRRYRQRLVRVRRKADGVAEVEESLAVSFVPMTSELPGL